MSNGLSYQAAERAMRLHDIKQRISQADPVASAAAAPKERLLSGTILSGQRL